MARNLEFNRQNAIAAAIQCFWQKGYAATSLADLLKAMGISRSSFYNSFGDKRQLFEGCVDHYSKQIKGVCQSVLMMSKENPWQGLQNFFTVVFISISDDVKRKGCLLVNTLAETSEVDDELKALALKGLGEIKSCWKQSLLQDEGFSKLNDDQQNQKIEQIFSLLLGWRLQSQAGLSSEHLSQQISLSLAHIRNN